MDNKTENMEDLRKQFEILTSKVNSQKIINEKLLRTVMKSNMSWINRYIYAEAYLAIPLVAILFLTGYAFGYVSLAFAIITIVFCMADVYADFKINKVIGKGWIEKDLLESRLTLVKMKKARATQMLISVPALLVWGSIAFLETMSNRNIYIAIGVAVGLAIGLVVGFMIYRKMQQTNEEMIRQIDSFVE